MVKKHMSFNSFEDLIELLQDCDAFHDCPQGKEPASADSDRDGYDSARSTRAFVKALAMACREFWLPKLHASTRGSVALDETSDGWEGRGDG